MLFLTPNQQCQSTEGSIFIIIIIVMKSTVVMITNIFVLCHKVVTSASVLGDDIVTRAPLFLQHPACCGCVVGPGLDVQFDHYTINVM